MVEPSTTHLFNSKEAQYNWLRIAQSALALSVESIKSASQ
jgi:hypothetical protein